MTPIECQQICMNHAERISTNEADIRNLAGFLESLNTKINWLFIFVLTTMGGVIVNLLTK